MIGWKLRRAGVNITENTETVDHVSTGVIDMEAIDMATASQMVVSTKMRN